ncbi:4'-phosphopantetheinyl transferase family protein [Aureimonas sp. AU40]|uniref:4'-phosphopantetheinyl transferase family protein n=1 Tax=Aureimonas sp. AU40 TaxID=1637747 RepID=UPI000785AFB1|nr:4'-phosphopantetheinyl transferase superfamily protein [Aureimonas sp. AU40]
MSAGPGAFPNPDAAALQAALDRLAPPGIRLACRALRAGDAAHLLPEEAGSITARQPARRDASGAVRWAARQLLKAHGLGEAAILRAPSGAPIWPGGLTGSLAHDETMAVAALGRIDAVGSLGVDVEPPEPLSPDLLALVVTGADRLPEPADLLAARLVFCAKEAVYKAVYPLDGQILDYGDIAVDLPLRRATTRSGRRLQLFLCTAPRLVVLAVTEA